MKRWLCVTFCLLLAWPAAADDIPLDDAGLTQYFQQRLQLYFPGPVAIHGPLELAVTLPDGAQAVVGIKDVQAACVADRKDCEHHANAYLQSVVAHLSATPAPMEAAVDVPDDKAGFVAALAAEMRKRRPEVQTDIAGMQLEFTRPNGRTIRYDLNDAYATCTKQGFHCGAFLAATLKNLQYLLVGADEAALRVLPLYRPDCRQAAMTIGAPSCELQSRTDVPFAPFFATAFANIAAFCIKPAGDGVTVPMVNADLRDLDLSVASAIALCERDAHPALHPLPDEAAASGPDGITTVSEPYAAAHALYKEDWGRLVQASGGHLLIALPARDTLIFMKGDGPADVTLLGARAKALYDAAQAQVSSDVYRWTDDGWVLATAETTMAPLDPSTQFDWDHGPGHHPPLKF